MVRTSSLTPLHDVSKTTSVYDEFHSISRNSGLLKQQLVSHKRHYDPRILELQRNAPLKIASGQRIKLASNKEIARSFSDVVLGRQSTRNFDRRARLTNDELATILFMGNGIKYTDGGGVFHRTVANSGNLGSVEIFFLVLNVEQFEAGIYHFDSLSHEAVLLHKGIFNTWLKLNVFYQPEFADASVVLFLTSNIGRLTEKYGERGYRLALLDTGHVSQNVYLSASSLRLAVCGTAGFIDDEVNDALGLDGKLSACLMSLAIGRTA